MLLVLSKFLLVLCSFHWTCAIHQQPYESNNGLRGSRPRNGSKRPSTVYSLENNGGDNQWKPILDLPPNHYVPKYRKGKPHRGVPVFKHSPNVVYTTEYYPKQIHQSASTNFVANQSLLVAGEYIPQQQQHVKAYPTKTKHQHTYIPTHPGSNYEVHEQVNEDAGGYESRFRYPVTSIPDISPVSEKHIHYVHYHKSTVLDEGHHRGRQNVRKIRLSVNSRRP